MDVTVFYAWQDDRPGKLNRYLIRDAANDACQRISDDPGNDFTVHLDQDTEGRPGMCDIPNTILEKIRDCDIFLADLTFVGRTDAEAKHRKQISNPNVLMELGYAVGCKATDESDGFDRVIGVMNVAYGKPEEQMFDIKRRRPIGYELPEGSEKDWVQRVTKSLSKDIEDALRTILVEVVLPGKGEIGAERFQKIREEFEASVREGSFHKLFLNKNVIAFTLAPDEGHDLDHATLRKQHLSTPGRGGSSREIRGRSIVVFDECDDPGSDKPSRVRLSIAELNTEGTILAADTFLLHSALHPGASGSVEQADLVPSEAFERQLIECTLDYGKILTQLNVALPWRLGITFVGVRGFCLYAGFGRQGRIYDSDDLITDPVVIRSAQDVSSGETVARLLKDTFDYIWREFGFPKSMNYDEDGNWRPR